ncbi:MAG: ATP-binding cassette domain-containing protein [Bacilli bacterium]|nr:ATP-binding cassette domain-containing protein [Bacilli bacterium]
MLKLVNIKKTYDAGSTKVDALKGISLNFRRNEFVSILGPSGCGKTTMLNIIGGLDKYTSGDLIISGISTKKYKDHDWDVYRNHRIGFIFQSYNLIPHQTVLQNVELALTISGIDKNERIRRSLEALKKVGLEDQAKKRPNQLSGGQCQRVAIARALVNEPDILLADEPTGALDTVTSKQIMDLIKEISKDKLVIMVTHNPEIAENYSTRIVRLLDGEISDDTNPCSDKEEEDERNSPEEEKKNDAKMSFFTAFRLSFRNLLTKIRRTLMVGIAGSIGIIGISSVLAVSTGINEFIDSMQEDMLSGNPITITEQTIDLDALSEQMSEVQKVETVVKEGFVNVNSILNRLAEQSSALESLIISNDITRDYVSYVNAIPKEYLEEIRMNYNYNEANNFYVYFDEGTDDLAEAHYTSITAIKQIYTSLLKQTDFSDATYYIQSLSSSITQGISNNDYLLSQYDIIEGRLPENKNEIIIVVNDDTELTDLVLAQLGYYTQEEFLNLAYRSFKDKGGEENYDPSLDKDEFSYEELLSKKIYWFPNDSIYTRNEDVRYRSVAFNYSYQMDDLTSGLELSIVGIIRPKEDVRYGTLSSGFYYTKELDEYIISESLNSEIVRFLEDNDMQAFNNSSTINNDNNNVVYYYTYLCDLNGDGVMTRNNSIQTMVPGKSNMMSSLMSSSFFGMGAASVSPLTIRDLGGIDIPNEISIYPKDFETKDKVLEYLDKWNQDGNLVVGGYVIGKSARSEVKYTDTLSLVIDIINKMINVVTTALIIFTAISLVVSTVMIGIITYVSVVERTKEIGVIRSLGGRKKDVGHLFNAETFIIGLVAGLIGVIVTYFMQIIGNILIYHFGEIRNLIHLTLLESAIMVSISVVLTLISGLIPSKAAARMDPVNALRSE